MSLLRYALTIIQAYAFLLGILMNLLDLLQTDSKIISVVGSGGKSTFVDELARELTCTVVIATSTHMFPPAGYPLLIDATVPDVERALLNSRVVCVGSWEGRAGGKLRAPTLSFPALAMCADRVLAEADGSKQLPLKAHAVHEPAVPEGSDETIQLVGATGFGGCVGEVVHRPELFCALTGCLQDDPCTPELYAAGVAAEHVRGIVRADVVVVNQADDVAHMELATRFSHALREQGDAISVVAGSVREHRLRQI